MGSARIEYASRVAHALLRTGSAAEAEPFVRALEQFSREDHDSGWHAAIARAMSLAEQGQTQQAIDMLDVPLTRNMVAGGNAFAFSEAHSPTADWMSGRFDARVLIAEFLIDRGRRDQAIEVMSGLDSLRQRRVAAYAQTRGADLAYAEAERAALARATNGGRPMDPARQRLVEDAIVVATTIPGIGYDPAWWFRATQRGQITGSSNARHRAGFLAVGAVGLQRGLVRVHATYERAGGTWGRADPINVSAAPTLLADGCPRNMVLYRGTQTTLTCTCAANAAGSIWGGPSYTDDSNICYAAVQAGFSNREAGGRIVVATAPGLNSYPSSTQNGVWAGERGPWAGSFTISASAAEVHR